MSYMEFTPPPRGRRCPPFTSEFGERPGSHRHRGGPRGRGFGPGFGPGEGRPFGAGRGRRRRGDVRLALLLLLSEAPRNGYQLMQAIEERSAGRWTPSPGSVYPALSQLEDEGLVRGLAAESGKTFELTDTGREHLAELPQTGAPWEQSGGPGEQHLHELHALGHQLIVAVRQVARAGDERQLEQARDLLSETRRGLYRILAEEPGDEAAAE